MAEIERDDDGMENCPTCGSLVCVVQDDEREGTSHYEPVGSQRVERLAEQLRGAVEPSEVERLADGIERDRREPDKVLCHVATLRRLALNARLGGQ